MGLASSLTADVVCSPARKENPPSRACGNKYQMMSVCSEEQLSMDNYLLGPGIIIHYERPKEKLSGLQVGGKESCGIVGIGYDWEN